MLGCGRPARRTIHSHRPGTGNSPRAQRGLRTSHQRSSPHRACGVCTIAIVPVPVSARTQPQWLTKDDNTPCGPLDTPCYSSCVRTNAQSHRHRTWACPSAQSQERWRRRGPRPSSPRARVVQAVKTFVMSSPGRSTARVRECARRVVGFSCISGR